MDGHQILLNYRGFQYSHSFSKNNFFETHHHETFEIIYILQGKGKNVIEGIEYPIRPHELFLIRPKESHSVLPENDCPYERFVISFDENALPDSLKNLPLLHESTEHCFSLNSLNNPIRAAFDTLNGISTFSKNTIEADILLSVTVTQIILLLTKEKPFSKDSDTVHRVIEYLNKHLIEELSLDKLSKHFFISKSHLCRIFQKQTGTSILTYFNNKRMTLAHQMIAGGESATTVSLQLGFHDYSTFYRAYKKQMGQAPVRKMQNKIEGNEPTKHS